MGKRRYLDEAPAKVITIGQIPRGYVDNHGDMVVRTPKGVKTTLSEAYANYSQTPVAVENIPGLTDYIIKQDNQDIQEAAMMKKRAGDRFVHKLGEERDKALMAIAAGAIGGGALASGLALAPVATIGGIGGGILGEKAWNKLYGDTWGQDVERWTNGYIPVSVGEYLNPGSIIGGGLGSQIGKIPGLAYKGFLNLPQTKRAVEVAMRTTPTANPIPDIKYAFSELPKTKGGKQQLKDVARYIATGKRTTHEGIRPYRTLARNEMLGDVSYGGFGTILGEESVPTPTKDIIDAYLYGDVIDPRFLKFVAKGKDFGIHTDYVNRVYPNKAKNIQVYEGGIGEEGENLAVLKAMPKIDYNTVKVKGFDGSIRSLMPPSPVNSAGHLIAQDVGGVRIAQDIYKFNPAEYNSKWLQSGGMKFSLKDMNTWHWGKKDYIKTYLEDVLPKLGLKVVNDIGTPVIIRSKPFRYKTMNEIFRDNIAAAIDWNPSLVHKPVADFAPLMPNREIRGPLYHLFD